MVGDDGDNVLTGTDAYSETIQGLAGDDTLYGLQGNDYLDGGEGNDLLLAGSGHDTMVGGAGNDVLDGRGSYYESEVKSFYGGAGNDLLKGSVFGDRYYFELGDGLDTIQEQSRLNPADHIYFGAGITEEDVSFSRDDKDLVVGYGDQGDQITIKFWFQHSNGGYKVEEFHFEDGSALTSLQINQTPVAFADSAEIFEDASVIFSLTELLENDSDPEGDALSIASVFNALNGSVTYDESAGLISFNPDEHFSGSASFDYTITDGLTTSTATVNVDVIGVNDAPLINAGTADAVVAEDTPLNIAIPVDAFIDLDGDALTYSATLSNGDALPSWLSFDGTSFSALPTNDEVGELAIRVIASDGVDSVSTDFTLSVSNVNDAPTLELAIADQAASENGAFIFTIPLGTFNDVDAGDTLSYEARLSSGDALPAWLSFDSAMQSFSGTPSQSDLGTLNIEVTATDSTGAEVSDVFDVVVNNVNDTPTINAGIADASIAEDSALSIVIPNDAFIDLDGDALTFSATLSNGDALPSWLSFDGTSFSALPTNDEVGELAIRVTASDGIASASTDFNLSVTNVNDAPELALAIADQEATSNSSFVFAIPEGTFSDVDAGDVLTLNARLSNGDALPAWLSFDAITGHFSGVPTDDNVGILSIEVEASDGQESVSEVFDINVNQGLDDPLNLVGNGAAETIEGGNGDDVINAKGGADTLYGHEGNDVLTGGGGSDAIYGGEGNDILRGSNGADHIYGGEGNDVLVGGKGNDTYYFNKGDGFDKVNNASNNFASETDKLVVDSAVMVDELWFEKSGNHLHMHLLGSDDEVRFNNWYANDKYKLDGVDVGDVSIDAAGLEQLVNAMASYGAPSGGSITLSDNEQAQVNNAIATAWS